jgi:hypothetical protein
MKKHGTWRKQISTELLALSLLFNLKIEAFLSYKTSVHFYHTIHGMTSYKTVLFNA